jgi:hypothetical protein
MQVCHPPVFKQHCSSFGLDLCCTMLLRLSLCQWAAVAERTAAQVVPLAGAAEPLEQPFTVSAGIAWWLHAPGAQTGVLPNCVLFYMGTPSMVLVPHASFCSVGWDKYNPKRIVGCAARDEWHQQLVVA